MLQENNQPIPIKFELTPIVNLLNVDTLDERYNISSKTILDWFLPNYLKYCKVKIKLLLRRFIQNLGNIENNHFLCQIGVATFGATFGKLELLFIPTSGHTVSNLHFLLHKNITEESYYTRFNVLWVLHMVRSQTNDCSI